MLRELDEAARALVAPRVVLFDWHATLVDTLDAMYHAVDDVLPQLPELGLMDALITHDQAKTPEDARLVDYVREHQQLHPKIKAERRISRTDIFEVLFGDDEDAKHVAHNAFNAAYRNHYGDVQPLEGGELDLLIEMHSLDVRLGILTNRDREFFEREFALVDPDSQGSREPRRGTRTELLVCRRQHDGRHRSQTRGHHVSLFQWLRLGSCMDQQDISGDGCASSPAGCDRR
jgi:hypothetical protein